MVFGRCTSFAGLRTLHAHGTLAGGSFFARHGVSYAPRRAELSRDRLPRPAPSPTARTSRHRSTPAPADNRSASARPPSASTRRTVEYKELVQVSSEIHGLPGGGATRTGRFRGPITRERGTAETGC